LREVALGGLHWAGGTLVACWALARFLGLEVPALVWVPCLVVFVPSIVILGLADQATDPERRDP
jgi:hypothetical protein